MSRKPKEQPGEPTRSFEIDVPQLRGALKDVADVVERRNTIPILSNVMMVVTPSSLTLTATDLDAWGERHVALDGDADPMTLTVEAAVLGRIVDKLPSDARVRLSFADGKLTVAAGRSRFSLPTLPVDDFPILPRKDWDAEFEMPAIMLAGALDAVRFAVSTEETRYYLNGVFVHAPQGADLRFAATNGHRLGRGVMALPDGAQGMPDIIIPTKVVKVLTTLLGRHEGSVDVRVSASSIRVEIGDTVVQAKLIDGTFPDYTRVIPTQHDGRLKVDREQLLAAVARVSSSAREHAGGRGADGQRGSRADHVRRRDPHHDAIAPRLFAGSTGMTIIDLPRYPVAAKIDWKPRQPSQQNRSDFTGATRTVILAQAPFWAASVSYPIVIGEATFRPWRSALMRLQGRAHAFRLGACEGPQHKVFQQVVVDGAGQQGYGLRVRGVYPGTGLRDGMFVTVGEDLHQVVADTPLAAADGRLTLSLMPHLAPGIADGLAVETMRPWALMRMATDQLGWTVDRGQQYSVSFDCESAR